MPTKVVYVDLTNLPEVKAETGYDYVSSNRNNVAFFKGGEGDQEMRFGVRLPAVAYITNGRVHFTPITDGVVVPDKKPTV